MNLFLYHCRVADQKPVRLGAELFQAMLAAEEVGVPGLLVPCGPALRIHAHSTDGIFHATGHLARKRAGLAEIVELCFAVVHVD